MSVSHRRRSAAGLDQRFQIAQRNRQHGVAFQFHDAEARGELGERRVLVGAHLQREAPLIGEPASGVATRKATCPASPTQTADGTAGSIAASVHATIATNRGSFFTMDLFYAIARA